MQRSAWGKVIGGRVTMALAVLLVVGIVVAPGDTAAPDEAAGAAAFNAWLSIPGVQGEAIKRGHENWIQVLTYGWAVEGGAPAATPRATPGRPALQPLRVSKFLDRSSPILALAAAAGTVYPEAQLVFYGAAGTSAPPLGVIRMTDVRVVGLAVESDPAAANARPTEMLSLSFGTVTWSYNEIGLPQGTIRRTISTGWNVARNAPLERSESSN